MNVAVGSDHGGLRLKDEIKKLLTEMEIPFHDFGTHSADSVDYPDFALAVAGAVASGEYGRGIILCGTGIGVSMAANKVRGIRAALCHDVFSARMSREHNDANVLTMGERVIGPGHAREVARAWLTAEFAGGRHAVRVEKLMKTENEGGGCGC